jgi:hypothetical protein
MCDHRTALRLRVISPVLLSQNNRQLNRPQSLSPTDFEGSWFNRWLCQGSGQHPLTGSPQDQWGFSFTQWPGSGLTACCSGTLAVLFGSGQSPVAGHHYYQGRHQGRGLGAGFSWVAHIWLICPSRNVIRSLALARSALSWLTNSLLARASALLARASLSVARACFGAISAPSGTLITHWLPTFCPVSNPLVNLRLTVFGETPRAFAASFIEYCIPKRVTHVSNPKPVFLGKPLPKVPMLGKCGSTASVGALWRGSGLPAARSINAQSLFSLKGNESW